MDTALIFQHSELEHNVMLIARNRWILSSGELGKFKGLVRPGKANTPVDHRDRGTS